MRALPRERPPRAPLTLTLVVLAAVVVGAQSPFRALDVSRPVPFFIADGPAGSGVQAGDRELAAWALASWARAVDGRLRLAPAAEPTALLRVHWVGGAYGQYGEMRPLLVDGRRGAAVYVRPDIAGLGPDMAQRAQRDPLWRDAIVYLTCVHELGHAVGLEHTDDARDIMYSFEYGGDIVAYFERYRHRLRTRADIAGTSALSDADLARVRRLYPGP